MDGGFPPFSPCSRSFPGIDAGDRLKVCVSWPTCKVAILVSQRLEAAMFASSPSLNNLHVVMKTTLTNRLADRFGLPEAWLDNAGGAGLDGKARYSLRRRVGEGGHNGPEHDPSRSLTCLATSLAYLLGSYGSQLRPLRLNQHGPTRSNATLSSRQEIGNPPKTIHLFPVTPT